MEEEKRNDKQQEAQGASKPPAAPQIDDSLQPWSLNPQLVVTVLKECCKGI